MTTDAKTIAAKTCTETDCGGKHVARGYCDKHYRAKRKAGEFTIRPKRKNNMDDEAMKDYLRANTISEDKGYDTECWTWMGAMRGDYGQISYDYSNTGSLSPIGVHRLAYKLFKGELIDGLVLDHMCHHKACCNPDHLRQVTYSVNSYNYFGSPYYTGGQR